MEVKRPPRTTKRAIMLNTLLYICKTSLRHSHIHRRMQVALFTERYGKTWKSPVTKRLVEKYGAHEC